MAFTTRKSLLNKVQSRDEQGWRAFATYYTPLIQLRAKDLKLSREDCEDLRQMVLMEVFKHDLVAKYDASRNSFRAYFRAIISYCAIDILRENERIIALNKLKASVLETGGDEFFDKEWHDFLYEKALEAVRKTVDNATYMAYELYVLRQIPADEVAKALSMSKASVYQAKTRIVRALHDKIEELKREEDGE